MLVKEFLAGFAGLDDCTVVFRDAARREIARGHLRGVMQAVRNPEKCRDYTLLRLLGMELQGCHHDSMFPYEYITLYVGRW